MYSHEIEGDVKQNFFIRVACFGRIIMVAMETKFKTCNAMFQKCLQIFI